MIYLRTALSVVSITPFVITPREVNNHTLLHKKYNQTCLRADRINERGILYKKNANSENCSV